MRFCQEVKYSLSGSKTIFPCELVAFGEYRAVLKYTIDRRWKVEELTLVPGTVTYGFYWQERPYNLYWWIDPRGKTVAHYFNLCDSTRITVEEVMWRDLIVDILVLPDGRASVLDEPELPDYLSGDLEEYISSARELVLGTHAAIIEEARNALPDIQAST